MNKQLEGFMTFIREQGVMGLAIGFILGGAVSKVVTSLVEDIINPLIGAALSSVDNLDALSVNVGEAVISYGSFIAVIIDFLIIAAVVYYIFKGLKLDKMDKKSE